MHSPLNFLYMNLHQALSLGNWSSSVLVPSLYFSKVKYRILLLIFSTILLFLAPDFKIIGNRTCTQAH